MHRVFVVEDHPIVREALIELLSLEDELEICGEAGSYEEALAQLLEAPADLVLVDVSLPQASGIDLVRVLRERGVAARTLIVSGHVEELYARQAFAAGANGYVLKDEVAQHLLPAVYAVLGGGSYVSQRLQDAV